MVLAPHCRGTPASETLAGRLAVRRFRYAPESLETLAYEGGMLHRLRVAPWRYLLLPFFLLAEWRALRRAVRESGAQVVHAHWILPHGLVAALAGGAALVCTSHGGDLFALRGRLARALKRWVLRRCAFVTVVSAAMKGAAVEQGAEAARVRVMPMGVDARELFVPAPSPRAPDEILFVGRLVTKKGIATAIEALALVRQRRPAARLTIVGAGPLEAELRAGAAALGLAQHVAFQGPVANSELPPYYRRAGVFVAPSVVAPDGDQEGLGLVIAEALACECPVVASDLPAIRDIVEDGVTGLLAPPGDPAALAATLLRVLGDAAAAQAMARRGRERVLERFDWQSVARGYQEVLAAAKGSA